MTHSDHFLKMKEQSSLKGIATCHLWGFKKKKKRPVTFKSQGLPSLLLPIKFLKIVKAAYQFKLPLGKYDI